MHFRFTIVETSLNRTEFRWKWLKFLEYTFLLASIVGLLFLVFELAIVTGGLTSKSLATSLLALLGVAGGIAWLVIIIAVLASTPDRNWLAAALERVDRRLLDRLNTLLFLEKRRGQLRVESFALRIARQTQAVLAPKPSPTPFSAQRSWIYFLGLIVVLAATSWVYYRYSPWQSLVVVATPKVVTPVQSDKPLELALPGTNNVEQNSSWGEVRITDPGADLKVTKVDVVPLQIEAAANQALKNVGWFSTINGAGETAHELPPPAEPRYAVYQPFVYLDELRLADWDVLTYYAKANTEKDNAFASQVYFLEVRPFREDILKMPGGEGGKPYQCLNQMSALITRQQYIIRQTHQHVQNPPEQLTLQQQDRQKLAEAETDLGDSVQHLYARMATEMENKPIGEALDNLAKAEKSLQAATTQLQSNVMNEAQSRERTALAELVAARKTMQKAISDNPSAFEEKEDGERPPVADSAKELSQIAEFRNEAKATRDFVQKTLEQQKKLEQQARANPRGDQRKLGEEEERLAKSLQDFQQQHPQAFNSARNESQQAHQAMSKAADSLQKRASDSRQATEQATQKLEKLNQSIQEQSAEQQLTDAYKLKQMLDRQIQTFGQCANPGNNVSDGDLQKTIAQSRETLNQLKRTAEQEPTRDAFGQPLRDALSGENKVDLDAKLNQLQQAQDPASKQERAGAARDALSKVSKAFTESEPRSLQMAQKEDALKTSDQESFNLGMAELQSLLKQLEKEQKIPKEAQGQQGQEALYNLQSGMRSFYGSNEKGNQLLLKLEKMLKDQQVEVDDLKKLMEELQNFSVETSEQLAKKEDKPDVTNIDPAKLPPAYRGRIQKYFQKLSEK